MSGVYRVRWRGYDWARRPWGPGAAAGVPATVILDAGAITVAGADFLAAVSPTLDTGAITVAGADLIPAGAGQITSLISIGAAAATADTASFQPSANALLLAFAGATIATGTAAKPGVIDTGGLVWTEIGDVISATIRETLYWARAELSPPARTATVASAGASSVVMRIVQVPGFQVRVIAAVPNVGVGADGAGDPSALLDAQANGGSRIVGGALFLGTAGVTPGDGYTELGETAAGSVSLLQTQYASVT